MVKAITVASFLFLNTAIFTQSALADYPSGSFIGYLNKKSVSASLSATTPASVTFNWRFGKKGSKYLATELSTGKSFSASKSGDNALVVKISTAPVVNGVQCHETDTVKVTRKPKKKAVGTFSAKISCNNNFKGSVSYLGNFKNGVGTTVPVSTPGSGGGSSGGNTKK